MRVEVMWWLGLGGIVGGCWRRGGLVVETSLDGDRERLWDDMCLEGAAIIEGGIGAASGFRGGKGGNLVLPLSERAGTFR
jgi:hypothetical protein